MPKIIENLENRLIEEAMKQIREQGYGAVTIRSVAMSCGVGVGTVYNYFPSKDDLLAAFMLQDWNSCMAVVKEVSQTAESPFMVLKAMHAQIRYFIDRYEDIFQDQEARKGFSNSYTRYHSILRSQLADPIRKFYDSDFAADFVAEAMLTWTLHGKPFDELYGMLGKLQ